MPCSRASIFVNKKMIILWIHTKFTLKVNKFPNKYWNIWSYSIVADACFSTYSLWFFFFFFFLFIYGCVGSSFLCEGFLSSCGKWGPLFITVRGPLTIAASLVAEHRLQTRRLSNCGSRAQLLRGMWDLPRPGLEPVSPALVGRFSTTAPPGKPLSLWFLTKGREEGKFWHYSGFVLLGVDAYSLLRTLGRIKRSTEWNALCRS